MIIEHIAFQVPEPAAMADWYVKHLGFSVARSGGEPSHVRFIKSSNGGVMLEIYRNPAASVPNYSNVDPLHIHVAFLSANMIADRDRLVAAGAKVVEDLTTTPLGDQILMLRDPWNFPFQLVKRVERLL